MIQISCLVDLLVCQSDQCNQSISICHKHKFADLHRETLHGKFVTHKSLPFDQSHQYLNFIKIAKIQNQIRKKITVALQGFQTNIDALVASALYTSEVMNQIFANSDEAKQEYLALRQVQGGTTVFVNSSFSQQFCMSISYLPDSKINTCYKSLCSYSKEWEHLNSQLNIASGTNSQRFQQFFENEKIYFIQYCQKLAQEEKGFKISDYINLRNQSKEIENDPLYFSREFTTFLIAKYQRNPEEQTIFDIMEYYLNFWEYFFVLVSNNQVVSNYINEEVSFYREYQQEMKDCLVEESLLSYRMWRVSHRVSKYLPSLKNPFFLETFVYAYVQELIEKKLFYPEDKTVTTWKEFLQYLGDYVKFVSQKKQTFDFSRYRDYFDFRNINSKFEAQLEKKKDVVYNKKYFLEYMHNEFTESNRLSIKKYKKFLDKKKEEEEISLIELNKEVQILQSELEAEEKQKFYEFVFINYVTYSAESNLKIDKHQYHVFKKNVLETLDETYVQEEENRYQFQKEEFNKAEQREQMEENELKEEEAMDDNEEKIAEIYGEGDSGDSDDEICICCQGNPYQCKQPECAVMGCCTACMLG